MRVLLVAPFYPPEVTGSSNFVADLAQGLTEAGHSVCVVTASPDARSDTFPVVRLPARRVSPGRIAFGYSIPVVLGRRNLRLIRKTLDEFAPDVVACHGQIFDITIITALMARRRGVPTVMTVHSAIWHDNPFLNAILAAGDLILAKLFLTRAVSSWIGVDNRTTEHTRARYSSTVRSIPVCLRRGRFVAGDAARAGERYGLAGRPRIVSIGHVVPVRNRVALVEALPHLLSDHPDLELVVVGRVADDEFIQRATDLGVSGHVKVVGQVPHDEIPDLLAASDMEVHDLQGYGLGIGSLEPIDAGLPIVAFVREDNLPGVDLRRVCPEGFLPDNHPMTIATAVSRILTDPECRTRVVSQQKSLLEEIYYVDVVTAKYVEEFTRLLSD